MGGGEFPGDEFFRELYTGVIFPEFLYEVLLMYYFLIADSILRVGMLSVIVRAKFSPGLNCLENNTLGWRVFRR